MTMPITKGLRLGAMTLADLKRTGGFDAALRNFEWFYIGAEFCENLIAPSVCKDAAALQTLGKKVCLLTPPATEKGIALLDRIFRELSVLARRGRLDPAGLEITINDFGALELASGHRLPFGLNSGRLLYDNVFEGTRKALKVHNALGVEFFRKRGITRHELSTTGMRRRTNFSGVLAGGARKFRLTLYYPYLNLTSTRTCLVGMRDVPPEESASGVSCARECRISSFALTHPFIEEKLLIRGNTVFLEFPDKFYASENDLRKMNVDRLVYAPFP